MKKREILENIAITIILVGGMYLVSWVGYLFN